MIVVVVVVKAPFTTRSRRHGWRWLVSQCSATEPSSAPDKRTFPSLNGIFVLNIALELRYFLIFSFFFRFIGVVIIKSLSPCRDAVLVDFFRNFTTDAANFRRKRLCGSKFHNLVHTF